MLQNELYFLRVIVSVQKNDFFSSFEVSEELNYCKKFATSRNWKFVQIKNQPY